MLAPITTATLFRAGKLDFEDMEKLLQHRSTIIKICRNVYKKAGNSPLRMMVLDYCSAMNYIRKMENP
jgi:hypothetical protein